MDGELAVDAVEEIVVLVVSFDVERGKERDYGFVGFGIGEAELDFDFHGGLGFGSV